MRIYHLDTERSWRGGQQQAVYLFEGLLAHKINMKFLCRRNSALANYLTDNELPHVSIAMRGEWDFWAGYQMAKICRQDDVDILVLHSAHAVSLGLWARLFFPKIKLIGMRRVDFHLKSRFSRFKYQHPWLDRIVCISKGIKQILIEDGVPENKIEVIHSGIDLHKFNQIGPSADFRQQWGIPEDHIVVGTVAALADHKDYPNLLHAAQLVLKEHDNVTFCAVGDGPDGKMIRQLAENLDLTERFIFTGFQENVGQFLKSFDIFVLASKEEGMGTSLLDAQAAGLPVVGTRVGGIPEVIVHEENGLLVPAQRPSALADALVRLIENAGRRKEMGQRGRDFVRRFSKEAMVEQHRRLYHTTLTRNKL